MVNGGPAGAGGHAAKAHLHLLHLQGVKFGGRLALAGQACAVGHLRVGLEGRDGGGGLLGDGGHEGGLVLGAEVAGRGLDGGGEDLHTGAVVRDWVDALLDSVQVP